MPTYREIISDARRYENSGRFTPQEIDDFLRSQGVDRRVMDMVDEKSGSSFEARAAVGNARTVQDKLATIEKMYPGSRPEPVDDGTNFIYQVDGVKTLFNPKGFESGDVAEYAREAGEVVGGVIGGALGSGAGPLGAAAAGSLGSEAGGQLVDLLFNIAGDRVDTRSTMEKAGSAAMNIAAGTLLGKLGENAVTKAPNYFRRMLTSGTPEEVQARAADIAGIEGVSVEGFLPAIAQNELTSRIASVGASMPMGGPLRRAQDESLESLGIAVDNIAKKFLRRGKPEGAEAVDPLDVTGVGRVAQNAAVEAEKNYIKTLARMGDDVERAAGDTPVRELVRIARGGDAEPTVADVLPNLAALQARHKKMKGLAPRSLSGVLKVSKEVDAAIKDVMEHPANMRSLRTIRTDVGRRMPKDEYKGPAAEELNKFYDALRRDIHHIAGEVGGDLKSALARHDDYVFQWLKPGGPGKKIKGLIRTGGSKSEPVPEGKVFAKIDAMARSGGGDHASLERLREQFDPGSWDQIAGSYLTRMGRVRNAGEDIKGDGFSPDIFLSNWAKMSDETRSALFGRRGGDLASALDQLERVRRTSQLIAEQQWVKNRSQTGPTNLLQQMLMGNIGSFNIAAGIGGAAIAPTVAASAATALALPYSVAKLFSSPAFVRWLSKGASIPSHRTAHIAQHMTRIPGLAVVDKALEEPLRDFIKWMDTTQSRLDREARKNPTSTEYKQERQYAQ